MPVFFYQRMDLIQLDINRAILAARAQSGTGATAVEFADAALDPFMLRVVMRFALLHTPVVRKQNKQEEAADVWRVGFATELGRFVTTETQFVELEALPTDFRNVLVARSLAFFDEFYPRLRMGYMRLLALAIAESPKQASNGTHNLNLLGLLGATPVRTATRGEGMFGVSTFDPCDRANVVLMDKFITECDIVVLRATNGALATAPIRRPNAIEAEKNKQQLGDRTQLLSLKCADRHDAAMLCFPQAPTHTGACHAFDAMLDRLGYEATADDATMFVRQPPPNGMAIVDREAVAPAGGEGGGDESHRREFVTAWVWPETEPQQQVVDHPYGARVGADRASVW